VQAEGLDEPNLTARAWDQQTQDRVGGDPPLFKALLAPIRSCRGTGGEAGGD
jgi:hypothetical protein